MVKIIYLLAIFFLAAIPIQMQADDGVNIKEVRRLATLIKYVTPHYQDKLSFARVQGTEAGKPGKNTASDLRPRYSLYKTPGILYSDNVGEKIVLEEEDYIETDFKEYRTPKMLIWNSYYSGVPKELDKLLSD